MRRADGHLLGAGGSAPAGDSGHRAFARLFLWAGVIAIYMPAFCENPVAWIISSKSLQWLFKFSLNLYLF
jgi:hypothetical protein